MSTFIISAGHGLRDPGATNGEFLEHLEAYKITYFLRTALETKGHTVEFISCFQNLDEKIKAVNRKATDTIIAAAVEIHFNSAGDKSANGTEVLYINDAIEPLAAKVSKSLAAAISTKDRGAKKRTDLGWLNQTKPPALIVEVAFISNDAEAAKTLAPDFHRRAAKAIADGLTA